jgi:transaldolase
MGCFAWPIVAQVLNIARIDVYACRLAPTRLSAPRSFLEGNYDQPTVTDCIHHADRLLERFLLVEELTYAIGHGAVGATTNPNIVLNVLNKEMHLWEDRIYAHHRREPDVVGERSRLEADRGDGRAWRRSAAADLRAQRRVEGPPSIQTNPMFYRNCEAIVAQARHFADLAPNMQVKMPVTQPPA